MPKKKTKPEDEATISPILGHVEPEPPAPMHPWDRQYGESLEAYKAFAMFMDAGVSRNFHNVVVRLNKTQEQVESWSIDFAWRKRVKLYDIEQERLRLLHHRNELDRMCDRHAKIARAMSKKLTERLDSVDISELAPKDIAQWFKSIVEVERHALGDRFIKRRRRFRRSDDDPRPQDPNNGRFVLKSVSQAMGKQN